MAADVDDRPVDVARVAVEFDGHLGARLDTLEEAVRYGHRIGLHIHAWISIKNTSSADLSVLGFSLKPGSELYLGTYGNLSNGNGLYWSHEPYAATHQGETYTGRVSLTQDISSSQLTTLANWVKAHNLWTLIGNCSWFAASAWDTVAATKVSAGRFIPTPSQLKASITSLSGWVLNKPWGTWGSSWGRYSSSSSGAW